MGTKIAGICCLLFLALIELHLSGSERVEDRLKQIQFRLDRIDERLAQR